MPANMIPHEINKEILAQSRFILWINNSTRCWYPRYKDVWCQACPVQVKVFPSFATQIVIIFCLNIFLITPNSFN